MVYFSSDWHLGHENIIKLSGREFSSVGEMDRAILSNYFSTVGENDDFYYLGDFSWYGEDKILAIWNSLPGRKHFVLGNHDKKVVRAGIETAPLMNISIEKWPVTLCHFPMVSWDRSHFGAFQLYGHHHKLDVNSVFPGKRINVSCEMWDYRPVSWEEIKREMNKLPENWDYLNKGQ